MKCHFFLAIIFTLSSFSVQAETISDESKVPVIDPDRYHVVTHYQIEINRPAEKVWPHLIKLNSWIAFDLIPVSGDRGQEGEIFRLYKGEDFYFQTTKIIPNQLYVGVNLPSTFKEEDSTGIAIFSLTEIDAKTIVNVTMSRQYTWRGEGPNPMREIRESSEFHENNKFAWEEKFLPKLRELVERQ